MTDRELLELAAKAAGLKEGIGGAFWTNDGGAFNSLDDNGDAFWLMVKLGIDIEFSPPSDQHEYVIASRRGCEMMFDPVKVIEDINGYREAATRRAIVRAAAEIGRIKID